tara:strand:- start:2147 stop:3313 length:1167 start_codon:yes stop_codon:yes gene_type:complete
MIKIKDISLKKYSSRYGKDNNSFGQPLGVKSIVIVSVRSYCGLVRSHELYAGIYVPELIENLVNYISPLYLEKDLNDINELENIKSIPFICNSGLFKSIKGAIDSCILQLIFLKNNVPLVEGLKNLLIDDIKDFENNPNNKFYASGGSVTYNSNECIEDLKNSLNFDGFKMRCGYQYFDADIKRVKDVYSYIKSNSIDFFLMIDFIQGTLNPKLSQINLEKYLKFLNNYNILWFEESQDPDNYLLYKNIPKELRKKFSLGESFTCMNEYIAYQDILKIFQIDVTHLGGFLEAIKVLNYFSEKKDVFFTSHIWGSNLALILNLALFKACNLIKWFEVPILDFDINKHLFKNNILDIRNISDSEIDMLLSNINLEIDPNYEFVPGSGYKI